MEKFITGIVAAAMATAAAVGAVAVANAEPNTADSHSVNVSIVNGVATVVVDGVQLYGEDAQPYIDAALARRKSHTKTHPS